MYDVRFEERDFDIEGLEGVFGLIDIVDNDSNSETCGGIIEEITDSFMIAVCDDDDNISILTDVPEDVYDEFCNTFGDDWAYLDDFENLEDAKAYCDKIKRIPFSEAKED